MRKILSAPLLALVLVGCSSSAKNSSTSAAATSTAGGFRGTYTSSDPTARYATITFYGDHLYFAYGASCSRAAVGCRTTGRYTTDDTAKTITVTDAISGASTTLPLSIESTSTPSSLGLRLQDVLAGGAADASASNGGTLVSGVDGGVSLLVNAQISPNGLLVDGKPLSLVTDGQGPALTCGTDSWCDLECALQGGTATGPDPAAGDDDDDAGVGNDPLASGDDDDDAAISSSADSGGDDDDDGGFMRRPPVRGNIRHADGATSTMSCARTTVNTVTQNGNAVSCDVIIAGGSTAAFTAALGAARESLAQTVCLLEPTDWVGGQLTSSAVPAIDWGSASGWSGGNSAKSIVQKASGNLTASFAAALSQVKPAEGACWVGPDCFPSSAMLGFLQQISIPNLRIFYNTVVTSAATDSVGGQTYISSLTAIQRTPRSGTGYDALLDQDLPDWYSPNDSARFTKATFTFSRAKAGFHPVVIDATEWGEVLVLSHAPYMQGLEGLEDPNNPSGGSNGNSACGQETVFDFVEQYSANAVDEASVSDGNSYDFATLSNLACDPVSKTVYHPCDWIDVFGYRRIKGKGGGDVTHNDGSVGRRYAPADGDQTIQNWLNDEPSGYMFLSHQDTDAQAASGWMGGVSLQTLAAAEARALAWHTWNRQQSGNRLTIVPSALGTTSGLAKMPYVRDTRRSIGINGFFLHMNDISVPDGASTKVVGTNFHDAVATGLYKFDRHMVDGCGNPSDANRSPVPYYIPFRAMTNQGVANLLVTGKTMAQGFLANAATRLQPVEWATGEAAGVAASYMALHGIADTTTAYQRISEIQTETTNRGVSNTWHMPDGSIFPPSTDPSK